MYTDTKQLLSIRAFAAANDPTIFRITCRVTLISDFVFPMRFGVTWNPTALRQNNFSINRVRAITPLNHRLPLANHPSAARAWMDWGITRELGHFSSGNRCKVTFFIDWSAMKLNIYWSDPSANQDPSIEEIKDLMIKNKNKIRILASLSIIINYFPTCETINFGTVTRYGPHSEYSG